MQRRQSSNTDGMPSESSLDQGLFDSNFQAVGLVLGTPQDVFIQMTVSSREERGPHHNEGGQDLPRPPSQLHHHQPLQHRTFLLHSAAGAIERHGNRKVVSEEPSTLAPAISDLKSVVTWLQREFPFLLILLDKVCFQHKLGIAVCWDGQHVSFANSTFKHLVSLREERSVVVALWMIILLSRKILYHYYTFSAAQLYNSPMFYFTIGPVSSFDLCGRVSAIRRAMEIFCSSQLRCEGQQCSEAGDCAICQGDFRNPIALLWHHVFCEECLYLWLDREQTCPLCGHRHHLCPLPDLLAGIDSH
uniref:Ring finger protein, transmembrane 2 n=1 Tax=Oncorhynchus mykiss TaxID=8022 RepID=A0A8C7USM8_ONCMY